VCVKMEDAVGDGVDGAKIGMATAGLANDFTMNVIFVCDEGESGIIAGQDIRVGNYVEKKLFCT